MLVGYLTTYAGNAYHFIHSKTNQIIYSHNIQQLNKLWGEYYEVSPEEKGLMKMMVKMTKIPQPSLTLKIMLRRIKNQKWKMMSPLHLTHTVKWSQFQHELAEVSIKQMLC